MRSNCVQIVKDIETIITFQKLESYKSCINVMLTVNVYVSGCINII